MNEPLKITSLVQLYDLLPENERLTVDVLRQIIKDALPSTCREKISYNVPFFYGKRGICIVWPASVPRGGIKTGVLLGFWHGNKLKDTAGYLERGTNKQVYYKIYYHPSEIDEPILTGLLKEATLLDQSR